MGKVRNLTLDELATIKVWLANRIGDLGPDEEFLEEEDPHLLGGLKALLVEIKDRVKSGKKTKV